MANSELLNLEITNFPYLLNSNSSFSKMRMGPVELRMMRGWPLKRQKTDPARAVPRKLSITPCKRGQVAQ